MTIYLLSYNNYYNRQLKMEDSFSGYASHVVGSLPYTSFKPNDYVNASIVFSFTIDGKNYQDGDYVVILDEDGQIVSRWYVIESVRLSAAQHRLTLHRDVVADFFNIIKESPIFVEKAMLDSGNPLLFNNENMTYNQIKQEQFDLYDESQTAWIGIYCGLDVLGGESTKEVSFKVQSVASPYLKEDVPTSGYIYDNDAELAIEDAAPNGRGGYNRGYTKYWKTGQYQSERRDVYINPTILNSIEDRSIIANIVKGYNFGSYIPQASKTTNAMEYDGVVVKEGNKYYQVNVTQEVITKEYSFAWSSQLGELVQSLAQINGTDSNQNKVSVRVIAQTVQFVEVQDFTATLKFTIGTATTYCKDAPYYLFYLPYSIENMNMAVGIAKGLGNYCYDVQVLPYVPEIRTRTIDLPEPSTGDADTLLIKNGTQTVGYLYSSKYSSFQFIINKSITVPSDAIGLKVENETSFVRLNSPNGSGAFDFIPAKNYGVTQFSVECSYKPITPYINVCPMFKGMYGNSFQDYRGLICQGDFSIPLINDAWVQYEQQNKNYLNAFNREIENMNVNNKYQRIQEGLNIGVGAMEGVVTGATGGAMVGGVPGAIVGGVVGGVSSLAGGIGDYAINEALRNEALDYKKDMFGYSLGNIKARPNTLAKVGSITIDSHLVPYLEYYSCTDEEKTALRNKIKYNGMSVGVIGTMNDYLRDNDEWNYFKGKLIRVEGLTDDYHLINTIADELNKGVYIK